MGYKILDVKADINEDVEEYFNRDWPRKLLLSKLKAQTLQKDILDIVDKHFEKIER